MTYIKNPNLSGETVEASFCSCSAQDLQPFGDCICKASQIEKGIKEFNKVMPANKVVIKLEQLAQDLKAVEYKLEHLTPYYSQHQIRVWRKHKRELKEKIKFFKGIRELQKKAKSIKEILASPHRKTV